MKVVKCLLIVMLSSIVIFGCDQGQSSKQNEDATLISATKAVVAPTDREVVFSISRNPGSFNGQVTIKNLSTTTTIEDWSIQFEWDHDITSQWSAKFVSKEPNATKTASIYTYKCLAWNSKIEPGATVTFGFGGKLGPSNADPVKSSIVVKSGGDNNNGDYPVLPAGPSGQLEVVYKTMKNNGSTIEGTMLIGNVNKQYYWNAYMFDVKNITFETTGKVTSIKKKPWGAANFTQVGNIVTIQLPYPSYIGINENYEFTITCSNAGTSPDPANFAVQYMRGNDIRYPDYGTLPASWAKNKATLSAADLIHNSADYYKKNLSPIKDKFIVYNQPHATQIQIGQLKSADYPVNTEKNVRIHMYSKNMALGVALVYEFLKINPNYMVALGTKENFSCGFIKNSSEGARPVMIDGQLYYWNMKFSSDAPNAASNYHDGPYQQEPGNFNDARVHMHDYLGPQAQHKDIVSPNIVDDLNDPQFISAGFSSGLSITMTRELLHAICDYNNISYNNFMDTAVDKDAEIKAVTYAYNRGYGMFLSKGMFGSNMEKALAAKDIITVFGIHGFGEHVPTILSVVNQMNNDTSDIYDAPLTWAEIEVFFTQLRKFYAKGIPSDAEWTAMMADVKKAFDVLKAHWGGQTVSFRYDFLTLLRVAKKHLPETNPRPTGDAWFYNVKGAMLN